jgi:exonuclease 3'-5' domain-containing protein 1
VFIFDILKGGSLMFLGLNDENKRGLKHILENKKIIKLIHDCRNDWDSLLHQYSVRIFNFIDTQEAYFIFKLFYYQEITLPISLSNFIETMIKQKLTYKDRFKAEMMGNINFWSERPLSDDRLHYASQDVLYLYKAWNSIEMIFNENLKEIVKLINKK